MAVTGNQGQINKLQIEYELESGSDFDGVPLWHRVLVMELLYFIILSLLSHDFYGNKIFVEYQASSRNFCKVMSAIFPLFFTQ